jgi:hypothetical protein
MNTNIFARFAAKSASSQTKVATAASTGSIAAPRPRAHAESAQSGPNQQKLDVDDDVIILEPPRKRLKVDAVADSVRVRVQLENGIWKEATLSESTLSRTKFCLSRRWAHSLRF